MLVYNINSTVFLIIAPKTHLNNNIKTKCLSFYLYFLLALDYRYLYNNLYTAILSQWHDKNYNFNYCIRTTRWPCYIVATATCSSIRINIF